MEGIYKEVSKEGLEFLNSIINRLPEEFSLINDGITMLEQLGKPYQEDIILLSKLVEKNKVLTALQEKSIKFSLCQHDIEQLMNDYPQDYQIFKREYARNNKN